MNELSLVKQNEIRVRSNPFKIRQFPVSLTNSTAFLLYTNFYALHTRDYSLKWKDRHERFSNVHQTNHRHYDRTAVSIRQLEFIVGTRFLHSKVTSQILQPRYVQVPSTCSFCFCRRSSLIAKAILAQQLFWHAFPTFIQSSLVTAWSRWRWIKLD